MPIQTPDWVKNAIFYQIFPDRFARSPRTEHPRGIQFKPWGAPPEEQGYHGGDLRGIVDKLDYLQTMGVNALYLNPVFMSASNHRYHTYDYYKVDPLLGGDEALRELIDAAHERGMYVVLDGVFNHASRGFWAFHHILENGGGSPYIDWFKVHDWPLRPYNHSEEEPHNYDAWWNIPALPKFNINNPGVRDYLLDVARYWVEFGIDGWRLDVPEEIDDESFWQEFRRIVKEANPDCYIVGEIWHEAVGWLQGDRFDGVMNYVFQRAALNYFGGETLVDDYAPGGFPLEPLDIQQFADAITHMHGIHDWEVIQAQLNLLDSHDTARTLWMVGGDPSAVRLCALLQMTMPGAPCIYYGDEIGMTGGHEPGSRGAFPWDDEDAWDMGMLDFYTRATAMRHAHPALRTGSFQTIYAANAVYAFVRVHERETAVVIFNAATKAVELKFPLHDDALAEMMRVENLREVASDSQMTGQFQTTSRRLGPKTIFDDVWQGETVAVEQGASITLTLPARDVRVLVQRARGEG